MLKITLYGLPADTSFQETSAVKHRLKKTLEQLKEEKCQRLDVDATFYSFPNERPCLGLGEKFLAEITWFEGYAPEPGVMESLGLEVGMAIRKALPRFFPEKPLYIQFIDAKVSQQWIFDSVDGLVMQRELA